MNNLHPDSFEWIPGATPMSDLKHLAIAEVVYFTVIYGLQAYVRKTEPEKPGDAKQKDSSIFKFSLCLHNAILCILSLAMFLGAGYEAWLRSRFIIATLRVHQICCDSVLCCRVDGFQWLFCEIPGRTAKVSFPPQ